MLSSGLLYSELHADSNQFTIGCKFQNTIDLAHVYSGVLYKAALPLTELDQSTLGLAGGNIADLKSHHSKLDFVVGFIIDVNLARRRLVEALNQLGHGAFARAWCANDRRCLAHFKSALDVFQNLMLSVGWIDKADIVEPDLSCELMLNTCLAVLIDRRLAINHVKSKPSGYLTFLNCVKVPVRSN